MEQHGEWDLCDIHTHEDGCFAESLPSGFVNLVDFPLDFEGELNDGRQVHAPDLEWWLEIGVGWTHDTSSRKPLSYAVLIEDHFGIVIGHQHTYENYHWVPSHGEWVNYYTGNMPITGRLVRMKHHVHMNLLHKSFFIAASEGELELTHRPFGPDGIEMASKDIPGAFASQDPTSPIQSALFGNAPTSADTNTWPVNVVDVKRFGVQSLDEFEKLLKTRVRGLPRGEEAIVCSLSRGAVRIDGYIWDRAGRAECREWEFTKGGAFTSVSLLAYHGDKVGPWSPDRTPARLPSHNQWNMYFEAEGGASHYFLYTPLVDDKHQRPGAIRRWLFDEVILANHWRVVHPLSSPLGTRLAAASSGWRRLAPLTLTLASLAILVFLRLTYLSVKRKRE